MDTLSKFRFESSENIEPPMRSELSFSKRVSEIWTLPEEEYIEPPKDLTEFFLNDDEDNDKVVVFSMNMAPPP